MRLGEVLREGRRRAGLEIVDVEQATKIRIKYLRALEAEEWDALPSPAYAKGFLRTYGKLLGLDADALVDEFRRQVETGYEDQPFGPRQVSQRESRRSSQPNPSAGPPPMFPPIVPILVGVVIAIGLILAVIGLVGGSGEGGDDKADGGGSQKQQSSNGQRSKQDRREARRERRRKQAAAQSTVEVSIVSDVAICLLDESPTPLIDGSTQTAGTSAGPFEAKRFTLRFPDGFDPAQLELSLDGEATELTDASGPAAFRIEDGAAEPVDPPPASCP